MVNLPLPPEMAELKEEIFLYIKGGMFSHPRSQQKMIGPSEIGTPCELRLAYKLQQHVGWNPNDMNWRMTVGTAVHAWLEEVFGRAILPDGTERFICEAELNCGEIDGQTVLGHSDIYDRVTNAVVDWKIVGANSLKEKKSGGPSQTYAWQAQIYGYGYAKAGFPVKHLMIVALPASGELHETAFLYLPYDESIALAAMERANRIAKATRVLGPALVLPTLQRHEDYCPTCPYFNPGSPTVLNGCPGAIDPAKQAASVSSQLRGIVPGM